MLTTDEQRPLTEPRREDDPEALIREARRLQRRRWIARALIASVMLGAAAAIFALMTSRRPSNVPEAKPPVSSANGTATVALKQPTALAVSRSGVLYIVDPARDQILRRLRNGRFAVVAGNGHSGFSGGGGEAGHAELRLQEHSGIAIASNGTVYIADSGNDRVRAVLPNGRIVTIAGGGRLALPSNPGASVSARSAELGGVAGLAIGPNQRLYVAAHFILRLTANHKLEWVSGSNTPAEKFCATPGCTSAERGFDNVTGLAFDGAGNLVVSGESLPGSGYPLAEIRANGRPIYLTPNAGGVGGQPAAVASGPNGSVVVATQIGVYQIPKNSSTPQPVTGTSSTGSTPSRLSAALTATTVDLAHRTTETFYGGDGITTGTSGQIYADAQPFIGLTFDTIVQLSRSGRAIVLWRS
jgi:hypothetical protein